MFTQSIYVDRYDWDITIYYDVTPRYTERIVNILYDMGCKPANLYRVEDLLLSGRHNQGLTYTDKRGKRTVIVVGRADNIGQYINTLVHEIDHLVDHISQYYGIPYNSEENSYLFGDVAEQLYDDAIRYVIRHYGRFL